MDLSNVATTCLIAAVPVAIFGYISFRSRETAKAKKEELEKVAEAPPKKPKSAPAPQGVSMKALQKSLKNPGANKGPDPGDSHPLFVQVIKKHGAHLICGAAVSPNGDLIATACDEGSIKVFSTKNIEKLGGVIASHSVPHGISAMDFGYNGKQIVVATRSSYLQVLDVGEKKITVALDGTQSLHKQTVKYLCASKGYWILTVGELKDTEVKIWSYKGELLAKHDTKQVQTMHAAWSPLDGRFVGVAAWSPGIKVMEVKSKMGAFGGFQPAMSLKSDKGCQVLAFDAKHTRAVVAQKDGVLSCWNIDVRYFVNEDPRVLTTADAAAVLPDFQGFRDMLITLDGKFVVAVERSHIHFFTLDNLKHVCTIKDAHVTISSFVEVPGNFILTGGADGRVKIWKMPEA